MHRLSRLLSLVVLTVAIALLLVSTSSAQGATLTITPIAATQNSTVTLQLAGFAPGEIISLWLTRPDTTVAGLSTLAATVDGTATTSLYLDSGYPVGSYSFSARGNTSERLAFTHFELQPGDDLSTAASGAVLFIDPPRARSEQTVALVGGGFTAGETVAFWLTLQNGAVIELLSGRTADGTFLVELKLPALPPGRHTISAYGLKSERRTTASLELISESTP